jgi:hypothetical protein
LFNIFCLIGRHFGINIKKEYDEVMKIYDIDKKVFKVVADQAANMKKAFLTEYEAGDSDDLQILISDLLLNQKKEDLKQRETIMRQELENEINEFNLIEKTNDGVNKKAIKAQELLEELILDDSLEDITDPNSDLETTTDTLEDADESEANLETLINDFIEEDQISNTFYLIKYLFSNFYLIIKELAYLPCLAHNIQLVIKDGLNLDGKYISLINHVAKDIVAKSKSSSIIAAELRKLNKKLNKKNITRWNSILFMIRSVLKLSTEEIKIIRNQMPSRTKAEKDIKIKFDISTVEREMLEELKDVLEMFEFVTDEFQSNRVNISRVYPAVKYLRENLLAKDSNDEPIVYKYSTNLRKDLLSSLNKRLIK